ncbi:unnamed protein product [Paramecium pentaurelia]|uniref:Uncharacterized protein n=1 Tax=Paramecium pentaurelia TaxID=43138 RepID=A0A8S1SVV5_9CILI|nr:unnamed protein product [Paramecium pentaurelia]CAD8144144.1 unnamed protein product [Paramecium pentaurelia]
MLILAGMKLKDLSEYTQEPQPTIKHLDVSSNLLKSGKEFSMFPNLETLIIDNNYFFRLDDFPVLPFLITLSANKNTFNNFEMFIQHCKDKFPKLNHVSLIKNPICPMFTQGEEENIIYRAKFIQEIPLLKNLDGTPVNPQEADPNFWKLKQQTKLQQTQNYDEQKRGTIDYNTKYQKPNSKTVKTKSEGNRFVKNTHL